MCADGRADPARVSRILARVGNGNPPVEGDELSLTFRAGKVICGANNPISLAAIHNVAGRRKCRPIRHNRCGPYFVLAEYIANVRRIRRIGRLSKGDFKSLELVSASRHAEVEKMVSCPPVSSQGKTSGGHSHEQGPNN